MEVLEFLVVKFWLCINDWLIDRLINLLIERLIGWLNDNLLIIYLFIC